MGRPTPTHRNARYTIAEQRAAFRRTLRRRGRPRFDRPFAHAREHADASGPVTRRSPLLPVVLRLVPARNARRDELENALDAGGDRAGTSREPDA